jgi:hypothetical protein
VNLLKTNLDIMQAEVISSVLQALSRLMPKEMHSYDRALVDMLKRGKVLDSHEILGGPGIDPRDSLGVKLVSNQLKEPRGSA